MPLSIVTLWLLVQDDQNEMSHDFFSHLSLTSASCDADDIVNNIIVLIRSRQLKQCAIECFWSCDVIDADQYYMMPTVSPMALFPSLGHVTKRRCIMTFLVCDAISTGIAIK